MNTMSDHDYMEREFKLWDRKLARVSDETLVYIQQRAYLLLEKRLKQAELRHEN